MEIAELIKTYLAEDIGDGDHTTLSCIPVEALGQAQLLVKANGIIAGVEIAEKIFKQFDSSIEFKGLIEDGTSVKKGDIVFTVKGKSQTLLQTERLVLNIMQRMSGIATETNIYVKEIVGTKTKILDTRKTTPGFRYFEKAAVKIGGGENHRMGLYDMILIKDNHIDFAGGIANAINTVSTYLQKLGKDLKIEIEARSFEEIEEILKLGKGERILIDNFTPEDTVKAVAMIGGRFETESSGNITLENIRGYAETGVDYISIGALTHQIKSLDLSLKAI